MAAAKNLAYFSHSYRKEDSAVVEFFLRLMLSEDIVASIDPPSNSLNSAKLERHLNATDGMLAVMTRRDASVSPYILYEIMLCLRARKPLLVFVEDVLSDSLIPARVLQGRFSRISYFRQIREHRRALQIFKAYLADKSRYQPSIYRRSCLVLGADTLSARRRDFVSNLISTRSYEPKLLPLADNGRFEAELLELVSRSEFAISFVDDLSARASYARGVVWGAMIPTITLTQSQASLNTSDIPKEFLPRGVPARAHDLREMIENEIDIFEEDFFDPSSQEQAQGYMELLVDQSSPDGHYSAYTRQVIIQGAVNMGDIYNVAQAGAVGPGAKARDINFGNAWQQINATTNLDRLAEDLTKVRASVRLEPESAERDAVVGQLALAEGEARKGDGASVLEKLSGVGKWTLDVATKIGADVAVKAIQTAIGLG